MHWLLASTYFSETFFNNEPSWLCERRFIIKPVNDFHFTLSSSLEKQLHYQGSSLRPYGHILCPEFETVQLNFTFSCPCATSNLLVFLFLMLVCGGVESKNLESGIIGGRPM